jgi:hypothetical protein
MTSIFLFFPIQSQAEELYYHLYSLLLNQESLYLIKTVCEFMINMCLPL